MTEKSKIFFPCFFRIIIKPANDLQRFMDTVDVLDQPECLGVVGPRSAIISYAWIFSFTARVKTSTTLLISSSLISK